MIFVISLSSVAFVNAEDKSSFNIFEFIKGLFSSGDKEMITSDNDDLEPATNTERTYHFISRTTKQTTEEGNAFEEDSISFQTIDSHHSISAYNETQAIQEIYNMFERWSIFENDHADINSDYQYTVNIIRLQGVADNNNASIQS